MRNLSFALLLALVAGAQAQTRASFTNVGNITDIAVTNSGLSYNVSLAGTPTINYSGQNYEIDYIVGFWVLSSTNISVSNSASGAWATNNSNDGAGGIAGWTVSYQNSQRLDPTEAKTFTYNQLNNVNNRQYGFWVRLGDQISSSGAKGSHGHANTKVYVTGTCVVPEPGTIAALSIGAAALLRRRRNKA